MSPLVTIGMPVYNGERFLEEALRSVLAQTCADIELLVSDNASTDRTMEILRDFAAADRRITIRRNAANVGAAGNYNLLVHAARGRYFKWAAHDDILAPTHLEFCVRSLEENPRYVLAFPTTVMIDEQGRPTGEDPWEKVDTDAATPHERLDRYLASAYPRLGCNAVFGVIRTDALRSTRLIGGYASSDKILLGELAMLGPFRQLPDPLFLRRVHPGSSVRANPRIEERNLWFDTGARGATGFIHWKWVAEYLRGIAHVPIPLREKARCAAALRGHMRRDRERLRAELRMPVRRALARVGLRRPPGGGTSGTER